MFFVDAGRQGKQCSEALYTIKALKKEKSSLQSAAHAVFVVYRGVPSPPTCACM
jgi:hypothetical protein